MNRSSWSPEEVEQLKAWRAEGRSTTEIAQWLERSDAAVRLKLYTLGYSSKTVRTTKTVATMSPVESDLPPAASPSALPQPDVASPGSFSVLERASSPFLDDLKEQASIALDLTEARRIRRQMEEQARQNVVVDRLIKTFEERLSDFRPRFDLCPPEAAAGPRTEMHSAVLCLGDSHIGKVVSSVQTNGFGAYDPWLYCQRLAYYEKAALRLLGRGGLVPIDALHIFFLGDVIDGVLNHGAEQELGLLLVDQCELAIWTLHQFLIRLAAAVPRIEIHGVVGNHGRLPNQRRVPVTNRFSNFDFFVYSALALSVQAAGAKNVTFHLDEASRQFVSIRGWNFQLSHGDELRGGSIPLRSIERRVANEAQRYAASNRPYVNYYVVGDKHTPLSLPLGSGSFLVNGSFVGTDEFAMQFSPVPPSQLLFWVDERHGKTLQYEVRLDRVPKGSELPYDLPSRIAAVVRASASAEPVRRCA